MAAPCTESEAAPSPPPGPLPAADRRIKDTLIAALPEGWTLAGKRVLDWGCGTGLVLRQLLLDERAPAELWGSDGDLSNIRSIEAHLSPPVTAVAQGDDPPLALEAGYFDLIYGLSAFTRLTDGWAAWLLELHRLLKPDGLLLVGVLGKDAMESLLGQAWDEELVGHLLARRRAPQRGALAFVSRWWLHEHWGRAFDLLEHREAALPELEPGFAHDLVLLRRRDVDVSVEELEALAPEDPRELAALRHNVSIVQQEMEHLQIEFTEALSHQAGVIHEAEAAAAYWKHVAEGWERHADAVAAAAAAVTASAQAAIPADPQSDRSTATTDGAV